MLLHLGSDRRLVGSFAHEIADIACGAVNLLDGVRRGWGCSNGSSEHVIDGFIDAPPTARRAARARLACHLCCDATFVLTGVLSEIVQSSVP